MVKKQGMKKKHINIGIRKRREVREKGTRPDKNFDPGAESQDNKAIRGVFSSLEV